MIAQPERPISAIRVPLYDHIVVVAMLCLTSIPTKLSTQTPGGSIRWERLCSALPLMSSRN